MGIGGLSGLIAKMMMEFLKDALEEEQKKAGKEGGGAGGSSGAQDNSDGGWIMAMAKALGELVEEKYEDMIKATEELIANGEAMASARFGGKTERNNNARAAGLAVEAQGRTQELNTTVSDHESAGHR